MGLMVFLFWGIRFCKVEKSDFKGENNNYQWMEVVKMVDGDTIEVKIDDKIESVRLIGIDAPEITEKTKEKGIEDQIYDSGLDVPEKLYNALMDVDVTEFMQGLKELD